MVVVTADCEEEEEDFDDVFAVSLSSNNAAAVGAVLYGLDM